MSFRLLLALFGLTGVAGVVAMLGCASDQEVRGVVVPPASQEPSEAGSRLPDLVVDTESPLLLEEPAETFASPISAFNSSISDAVRRASSMVACSL